jgi:hypothetical protein
MLALYLLLSSSRLIFLSSSFSLIFFFFSDGFVSFIYSTPFGFLVEEKKRTGDIPLVLSFRSYQRPTASTTSGLQQTPQ